MKPEISQFLPYLLNQATELVSHEFQPHYKERYGMLRTEWRVLFHLGQYGPMTAKEICEQAALHKTKVSRAVVALEAKRYVSRASVAEDRRFERISVTRQGNAVFLDLAKAASQYDRSIEEKLGKQATEELKATLLRLIDNRRPGSAS